MAIVGLDVEQIRSIGTQLQGQSGAIDGVMAAIEGLINQAIDNWTGPDATEFQSWWNTEHKPALQRASQAIHGLGQSAINNAGEQERVSSV